MAEQPLDYETPSQRVSPPVTANLSTGYGLRMLSIAIVFCGGTVIVASGHPDVQLAGGWTMGVSAALFLFEYFFPNLR